MNVKRRDFLGRIAFGAAAVALPQVKPLATGGIVSGAVPPMIEPDRLGVTIIMDGKVIVKEIAGMLPSVIRRTR